MSNEEKAAFPSEPTNRFSERGMTLRDYFAGQALAGAIDGQATPEQEATFAYEVADAMLTERAKAQEMTDDGR